MFPSRLKILLTATFVSALPLGQTVHAQSSVRGPLQPEHNPPHKFQSFSQERWDASSLAPAGATKWWQDARFGMFIHFGVASLKGVELGWGHETRIKPDKGVGPIPDKIYDNLYKEFTLEKFDAAKWVELARQTGMKYIVVITKHHDGFHMWDTAFSDYKITKSPFGRDYLKELVDAAHAAKMPIGVYFSQRDWFHPDYDPRGAHPGRDHKKYIEYQINAVRELLTKYGKIDVLWFDAAAWGSMFKESDWDSERLYRVARECQPNILINNRASIPGDFDTPEQHVGAFQTNRPWESVITLTDSWGYKPSSPLKTPKQVIDLLVQSVTGDGNLMLNVGPMPTGEVAPKEIEVLKVVGEWMAKYGESIYSTRGGPIRNGEWGGTTFRDNTVYVHVLKWPSATLKLQPIEEKIVSARALTGGTVAFEQNTTELKLTVPEKDRGLFDTIIELKLDRPVSKIYPLLSEPSIFDGPGYGSLFSSPITFETSSKASSNQAGCVVRTSAEKNPWCVMDLGTLKNVKGIRITHPSAKTGAAKFEILVSPDGKAWNSVWKTDSIARRWEVPVTRFDAGAHVPGVSARYIKFARTDEKQSVLEIKQIEIFGDNE